MDNILPETWVLSQWTEEHFEILSFSQGGTWALTLISEIKKYIIKSL